MSRKRQYDEHIYAYIRVSTGRQTTDSQLLELNNYCTKNRYNLKPDHIIVDEGVSGKIEWRKRKINDIINLVKNNDIIIVPEISRLGRNMDEVNEIIAICKRSKVKIIDIKNNLTLDDSFQSGMMANLYSMFAQMERQLISERVKQGLLIAKQKGRLTGRARGIKKNKLDSHTDDIVKYAQDGLSYSEIGKKLDVDPSQVRRFMMSKDINKHYRYGGHGQHKNLKIKYNL